MYFEDKEDYFLYLTQSHTEKSNYTRTSNIQLWKFVEILC